MSTYTEILYFSHPRNFSDTQHYRLRSKQISVYASSILKTLSEQRKLWWTRKVYQLHCTSIFVKHTDLIHNTHMLHVNFPTLLWAAFHPKINQKMISLASFTYTTLLWLYRWSYTTLIWLYIRSHHSPLLGRHHVCN